MDNEPQGRARVDVADWDAVTVRVAMSPMHTVLATLFEIVAGARRGASDRWIETVLNRSRGLDLSPFAIFATPRLVVPDFLTLSVNSLDLSFDEQLERVRCVPREKIVADIHADHPEQVPEVYEPWLRDPEAQLQRLADALKLWWELVLGPSWPRLSVPLHTEVLRISRIAAGQGARAAVEETHPRVRTDDAGFEIAIHFSVQVRHEAGSITVVPMACGPGGMIVNVDHPAGPLLGYAAPGVSEVLDTPDREVAQDLADLLGPSRARLFTCLDTPTTNQAMSAHLHLARSTVSAHLQSLALMGLVAPHRIGRYVYWEHTARGRRLRELFEES